MKFKRKLIAITFGTSLLCLSGCDVVEDTPIKYTPLKYLVEDTPLKYLLGNKKGSKVHATGLACKPLEPRPPEAPKYNVPQLPLEPDYTD